MSFKNNSHMQVSTLKNSIILGYFTQTEKPVESYIQTWHHAI